MNSKKNNIQQGEPSSSSTFKNITKCQALKPLIHYDPNEQQENFSSSSASENITKCQALKPLIHYIPKTSQEEPKYPSISENTDKQQELKDLIFYDNDNEQEKSNFLLNPKSIKKLHLDKLNYENNAQENEITSSSNFRGNIGSLKLFRLNSIYKNTKLIKENSLYSNRKNSLLKSRKDLKINIELLKRHVLNYFLFIYCDDMRLYDINKGYYKKVTYHETAVKINSIVDDDTKLYLVPSDIKETYKSLKYDPKIQVDPEAIGTKNKFYINCLNGILNLTTCPINVEPHNPNKIFFNYINANYSNISSIEGSYFNNFLNTITVGDIILKKLIQQVLGYILSNLNNAKKAFFLYGKSNSGKSVFLNLISSLCGEENVSNVSLQNLSNEKYTAELFGKTVNICSELPDKDITDTEIFKALTSETDKVSARYLYGDPFSFYNKAKLIFATNNLPNIKTNGYKDNTAFFNRIIIIPFRFSIPEDKQDKNLVVKLLGERDLIFSWAIKGLVDYIKNNFSFIKSESSEVELKNYVDNGNTMLEFINSRCNFITESYIHMDILFKAYVKFCENHCFDIPKKNDKKHLKNLLIDKFDLTYKRINRGDGNKYGFEGICLRNNFQ